MERVTIRVPATTANLAAGFDVLGCALGLYNTLSFTPAERLSFSGCDEQYQTTENLAYVAYERVWRELRRSDVPPVHIHIRGLGSSAALIAAGAMAANIMAGKPFDKRQLLSLTTEIEGHPDNLAPALLGGLTASMLLGGQVYTVEYLPHPELRFVALSPDFPLSTHEARRVLPSMVSHSDAVRNAGFLAVLLRAIEQGDEELIAASLQDRLHQPYRRRLIPEYDKIEALANQNGCRAVCISGAGPTILCVTRDEGFAARMERAVFPLEHHWQVRDLPVDYHGAVKLS